MVIDKTLKTLKTAWATKLVSSWTARASSNESCAWYDVCWSPELGIFCAVGDTSGTTSTIMTSPDGITWTTRTSANSTALKSICWSPELKMFVAVASSGTGAKAIYSYDGITWYNGNNVGDYSWQGVDWSPELGLFVAVSNNGGTTNSAMRSSDGINWTVTGLSMASYSYNYIVWVPFLNRFYTTCWSNGISYSSDGITWINTVVGASTYTRDVTYSNELGLLIVVLYLSGGNTVMATSPDGLTWTQNTNSALTNGWIRTEFAPELGICVTTAAATGTGTRIMTSLDGATWVVRTSAADNNWGGLCLSPELPMFCAIASSGTSRVMTTKV